MAASAHYLVYITTVSGTLIYTVDFARDPVIFYIPSSQTGDFLEAAIPSNRFDFNTTIKAATVDSQPPSVSVVNNTQLQFTFATDPGNNPARMITGVVEY